MPSDEDDGGRTIFPLSFDSGDVAAINSHNPFQPFPSSEMEEDVLQHPSNDEKVGNSEFPPPATLSRRFIVTPFPLPPPLPSSPVVAAAAETNDDERRMIQVILRLPGGANRVMMLDSHATVADVLAKINGGWDRCRLVCNGRSLEEDESLFWNGVKNYAVLNVIIRLDGGMRKRPGS